MKIGSVLCVDDEPTNLEILRQALRDSYALTFARSGEEALAAFLKHKPSLVLLDVEMPDMNGYEVCRTIRSMPYGENVPILFVTGRSSEADEKAGFDAGGVDYITKPISAPIVQARIRTHLSLVRMPLLEQSHRDAISMLGEAGHYNDNDTGLHIWRMASYSRALAAAVGWGRDEQELLEQAAPMHDTGKIGIPDSILKKPGPLTEDEWVIMRTHPKIGFDILSKSDAEIFRLAAEVAFYHHERWDGTGYPHGLSGNHIPESARIVAVADMFDALCMKRPYKDAWPLDKVQQVLRENSGVNLEPRLVEEFFNILPEILEIQKKWDAREEAIEGGIEGSAAPI